jgi:hypothetical protein
MSSMQIWDQAIFEIVQAMKKKFRTFPLVPCNISIQHYVINFVRFHFTIIMINDKLFNTIKCIQYDFKICYKIWTSCFVPLFFTYYRGQDSCNNVVWSVNSEFLCFNCNFFFAPLWRMGPHCSSAETQVWSSTNKTYRNDI